MDMHVLKNDGTLEVFDRRKVETALMKSGASSALAKEVTDIVEGKMHPKMRTQQIYELAFRTLSDYKPGAAFKYGLKRALINMGPEGYPFETYVGAVLHEYGYETQLRQIMKGRCIDHEVDVVARKDGKVDVYECKFHNQPGFRCHIQNALYTYARYLDLKEENKIDRGILATNTKFSYDVIKYSGCAGLGLLGWSYPDNGSLQQLIDGKKVYPANMLSAVDRYVFGRLHWANLITVKSVLDAPLEKLIGIGISKRVAEKIKEEAHDAMNWKS